MVKSILFISFIFLVTGKKLWNYDIQTKDIKTYEFGQHTFGEQLAYKYEGIIRSENEKILLNVTHNHTDLQNNYTYVNIITPSNVTDKLKVDFDSQKQEVTITHLEKDKDGLEEEIPLNMSAYAMPRDENRLKEIKNLKEEIERYKLFLISI